MACPLPLPDPFAQALGQPSLELPWLPPAAADRARAVLDRIVEHSPFLTRAIVQEVRWLAQTLGELSVPVALGRLLRQVTQPQPDLRSLMIHLRVLRRRAAILIALEDLGRMVPFARTLGHLSLLGGAATRAALRGALEELIRRRAFAAPATGADPAATCGIVAYAMGKMGGGELNYSSDIDLVLFHEPSLVPSLRRDRLGDDLDRIARLLVQILEQATGDGYVLRTDLRLRPDPGSTPAIVSVAFARTYYATRGQNWERAAFIRARPVAGDRRVSALLEPMFQRWIWRRNLDFAAIRDIQSIRRQIQTVKGTTQFSLPGHNVKVGQGGIREIELLTQTVQLIYGGRHPEVRMRRTERALQALAAARLIDRRMAGDLASAYLELRQIEHRLQMVADRQTHSLPDTLEGIARFAGFTDCATLETLAGRLGRIRGLLARAQSAVFPDAPALHVGGNLVFTGVDDDPATLDTLTRLGFDQPAVVSATLRAWHYGRYPGLRQEAARQVLTELTPALLVTFGRTPAPMAAIAGLDQMLKALPSATGLLSLLHSRRRALETMGRLMAVSPVLAERLAGAPQLVDMLLDRRLGDQLPDPAVLAVSLDHRVPAQGSAVDEAMDELRRFVKEQQLVAAAALLQGADPVAVGAAFSALADLALRRLVQVVESDFAQRAGRVADGGFAVLALGKHGGQEPTMASDLDLVFVYAPGSGRADGADALEATVWYGRLARRMIQAATALTAEGRLFQLDLRLRPHGEAGPLAQAIDGVEEYFRGGSAWTWERLALTRARVLCGPPALTARLEALRAAVLADPGPPERVLDDVRAMMRRTHAHKSPRGPWDIKRLPGGLMDVEFILQTQLLLHGRHLDPAPGCSNRAALAALAAARALPVTAAEDLGEALGLYDAIRHRQALLPEGETADPTRLAGIGPTSGIDPARLLEHLDAVAARVRAWRSSLLGYPGEGSDPADAPA